MKGIEAVRRACSRVPGSRIDAQLISFLARCSITESSLRPFGSFTKTVGPRGATGIRITVPVTTSSDGVVFHAGVNYLTSSTALPYVRQSSLTEEGRVLRQQALLRAIVAKVVNKDLITNPLRDLSLLDAFTAALSVDTTSPTPACCRWQGSCTYCGQARPRSSPPRSSAPRPTPPGPARHPGR